MSPSLLGPSRLIRNGPLRVLANKYRCSLNELCSPSLRCGIPRLRALRCLTLSFKLLLRVLSISYEIQLRLVLKLRHPRHLPAITVVLAEIKCSATVSQPAGCSGNTAPCTPSIPRELRPAFSITRSESILLDVSSMRPISEVTSNAILNTHSDKSTKRSMVLAKLQVSSSFMPERYCAGRELLPSPLAETKMIPKHFLRMSATTFS